MRHGTRSLLLLVAGVLLSCLPAAIAHAGEIRFREARVVLENDIVKLDADATLKFSDDAVEALRSGVRIFFDLDIRIRRARRFLWDPKLHRARRRFSLERHALSDQYIITDAITGERRIHGDLAHAIEDLGRIRKLPIVDYAQIRDQRPFEFGVRLRLDIDALPAPMLPLAYVSPSWRMSSGWYRCQADL